MTREVVCEPLFLFTKFLRLVLLYIILSKNKTLKYKNPRTCYYATPGLALKSRSTTFLSLNLWYIIARSYKLATTLAGYMANCHTKIIA